MKEHIKNDTQISFIEVNNEEKKLLLDILDYGVDAEGFIIDKKTKKHHICPFSNTPVSIDDSSLLPGSTIIINTTALTLSEYFSRYLEER
ncbi:MAG: hypothetical protein WC556_10075 [Candidatus Methanoperedens sp.]